MSELVAYFVDDLPCSEEKVALDVVGIHRNTGTAECAAKVMESAGVGEKKELEEAMGGCSCTRRTTGQIGTRKEMDVDGLTDGGGGTSDRTRTRAPPPSSAPFHLPTRPSSLHVTSTSSASYFVFTPYTSS
jgi:hypothetical protein